MSARKPRDSASGPRLPHPQPPSDPAASPFVGNVTVEDNLAEAVEVALWTALGEASRDLTIGVRDGGIVELRGRLPAGSRTETALAAVRGLGGVSAVLDRLTVAPARSRQPAAASQHLVYLRRFCAADEPSTSAAIRQAVARLDAWFSDHAALSERLVVVYRNLRPATVTLDIAMPIDATAPPIPVGSELRIADLRLGMVEKARAEPGFAGLLDAKRRIVEQSGRHDDGTLVFWQSFDSPAFRPWRGHPEAMLYLSE